MKNKKKPAVKPAVSLLAAVTALAFLLAACNNEVPVTHDLDGGNDDTQVTATQLNLSTIGLIRPANGATPVSTILLSQPNSNQYTAQLKWKEDGSDFNGTTFGGDKTYSAELTFTVKKGYTFKNVNPIEVNDPDDELINWTPGDSTPKKRVVTLTYPPTSQYPCTITTPTQPVFPQKTEGYSLTSLSQSVEFDVNGTRTDNITVSSSSSPNYFQVSIDDINFSPSITFTLSDDTPYTFYVRPNQGLTSVGGTPPGTGTYTENITISSENDVDFASVNFMVSFTVLPPGQFANVNDAVTWISTQTGSDIQVRFTSIPTFGPTDLNNIINAVGTSSGSNFTLDFSNIAGSGFTGGFNPSGAISGKDKVTSIILPASCNIAAGTASNPTFNGFTNLTSVSGDVIEVGAFAFAGLSQLANVDLPGAITIGDSAFKDCTGLQTVTLPVATTIGESAFEGCDGLQTVTLTQAATLGSKAFKDCTTNFELYLNTTSPTELSLNNDVFEGTGSTNTITIHVGSAGSGAEASDYTDPSRWNLTTTGIPPTVLAGTEESILGINHATIEFVNP